MNKIINGNCIDIMTTFPDNYIDLTVTSPPYDNLRTYQGYDFDFEGIANQLHRITKQGGVVVWVVGDTTNKFCESLSSFNQAIYFVNGCGFKLLDTMIYLKNNYPPAYPNLKRYANVFEYMFVFVKGDKPKTFNSVKEYKSEKSMNWGSDKAAYRQKSGELKGSIVDRSKPLKDKTNVWAFHVGIMEGKNNDKFKHPATFPDKLANNHVLSWSNEGDLILDPMCGSGTTCKMAMVNNRNYIGIDISEEYCEIARKRIAEHEQQLTIN